MAATASNRAGSQVGRIQLAGELPQLGPPAVGLDAGAGVPWVDGLALTAFGVSYGLQANVADYLGQLAGYLPPGSQSAGSAIVERLYSFVLNDRTGDNGGPELQAVFVDAVRLADAVEARWLLEAFEADLKLFVAEMASDWVFVHAGAVEWRGQAIILPGRSFSGKTSLVAALVAAGAGYLSDEFAVLDFEGRVHPYARALSVRASVDQRGARPTAEDLGGRAILAPVPAGLVLISQFQSGSVWQPQRRSAGAGALALLSNTVSARRRPEQALNAIERVVAQAVVIEAARGEAGQTARLLLDQFDAILRL